MYSTAPKNLNLHAGELVQVRSREEILATLDGRGCVDNLPFMPEMLKFCGQTLRVYKRADKTCDTIEKSGARRMLDTVHLNDIRCDGEAHGGCQASCLMFWKEQWLRRVPEQGLETEGSSSTISGISGRCTVQILHDQTRDASPSGEADAEIYSCQITKLLKATSPLPWWDVRQYIRDVACGNTCLVSVISAFGFFLYRQLLKVGGYRMLVSLYDKVQDWRGGVRFPYRQGQLKKTPAEFLNLCPGELVQIKSHEEILRTLDTNNKNRGLWFDVEMVPYCGKTARVLKKVTKIINEKTGKMMNLPNDCLILDGVYCRGEYSRERLFCPRSIYSYWREIWVRRVDHAQ